MKVRKLMTMAVLHYTNVASVNTLTRYSPLTKGSIACRLELPPYASVSGTADTVKISWAKQFWMIPHVITAHFISVYLQPMQYHGSFHPSVYSVPCRWMGGKVHRRRIEMDYCSYIREVSKTYLAPWIFIESAEHLTTNEAYGGVSSCQPCSTFALY